MSETFLIKKSAHDDTAPNALDPSLAPTKFVIGPGEINGIGGLNTNSDLKFYGFGTVQWGEGVNQNAFRILENNACPQKINGDPDYDANNPIPKDERDLGTGNGINVPNLGQTWFNTTDEELYMYVAGLNWRLITQTSSDADFTALQTHMDDDTVHLTIDQNTYLDNLNLPTLTAAHTNQLIGITGNIQASLDSKVNNSGDTMSGRLTIDNGGLVVNSGGVAVWGGNLSLSDGITVGDLNLNYGDFRLNNGYLSFGQFELHSITSSTTTASNTVPPPLNRGGYEEIGNDFNIRIGHRWHPYASPVAEDIYTSGAGAVLLTANTRYDATNNPITSPTFSIKVSNTVFASSGDGVNFSGIFDFLSSGDISTTSDGTILNDQYLTTQLYVETNYLPRTGGQMVAGSTINFSSNGSVSGLREPASNENTYATPKSYVDSGLALKANIAAPNFTNAGLSVPTTVPPIASGAPATQIATVGYVDALADSTAESVAIANSLANSTKIAVATFNSGNDPRSGRNSYYNYYEGLSGLTGRNIWRNLYYITFTPDAYGRFRVGRGASHTPLATVTNETNSNTMRWSVSVYIRFATDDSGNARFAEVRSNGTTYSPTQVHTRTTPRSYTMTWTRDIPPQSTYTFHLQGQLTTGWNFDAIYLHRINSNSILFV